MKASSKKEKSTVVTTIVETIRSACQETGGGFIRKDPLSQRWYEVTDKIAREKVGQALRDASIEKFKDSEGEEAEAGSSCDVPEKLPSMNKKRRRVSVDSSASFESKPTEVPESSDRGKSFDSPVIIRSPQSTFLCPQSQPSPIGSAAKVHFDDDEVDNKFGRRSLVRQCNVKRLRLSHDLFRIQTNDSSSTDRSLIPSLSKADSVSHSGSNVMVVSSDSSLDESLGKRNGSSLISKSDRPKPIKTKCSSMLQNYFSALANLHEDWSPAWSPADFEPMPLQRINWEGPDELDKFVESN